MELQTITLIGGPKDSLQMQVSLERRQLSIPVMIDGEIMVATYNKHNNHTFHFLDTKPVYERKVIYTQQPHL